VSLFNPVVCLISGFLPLCFGIVGWMFRTGYRSKS
jgi:hypothetical protein